MPVQLQPESTGWDGLKMAVGREFAAAALLGFYLAILLQLQGFEFTGRFGLRWFALGIAFAPIVAPYLFFRAVAGRPAAVLASTLIALALTYINDIKLRNTTQPLVWSDLADASNWSIAMRYRDDLGGIGLSLVAAAAIASAPLLLAWRWLAGREWREFRFAMPASAIVIAVIFMSFSQLKNNPVTREFAEIVETSFSRLGSSYVVWDWPANVRRNGLFMHLVQTSSISPPREVNERAERQLEAFKIPETLRQAWRPKNIVVILCEACWGDEDNFRAEFDPLRRLGFVEFTAISPEFGGGTVNSAFELLTGLPARQILTGIIFQEYADLVSPRSDALPRRFKVEGYHTYEIHNHKKTFWRRDVVSPKLGFDRFISEEDMQTVRSGGAIRDEPLYEEALQQIARDGKNFIFITTMFTHGGYSRKGDFGEGDYAARLKIAIKAIADFTERALEIDPGTLVFVIGDHKPALLQYLYERKVLAASDFSAIGQDESDFKISSKSDRQRLGEVPAFLFHRDRERIMSVGLEADGRSFHCVSKIMNDKFFGTQLEAFRYASMVGACDAGSGLAGASIERRYPEWMYRRALFDEGPRSGAR
jgi:hypothetical protein